ncbi:MAG: DUF1289 domain-containing protein [Spongiibacteraceae bacterium]
MPNRKNRPTIESPCVRNCCLDGEDFCMGCGRHIDDILRWHQASSDERAKILQRAEMRQAKLRSAVDKP